MKKIDKFRLIKKEEGLIEALLYCVNFLIAKTGWFGDHKIFGRIVELRGNMVSLNGCRFDLSSPLVSTAFKSRFLLGRYERKERNAVRTFLDPTLPVIEFGASIGVVSCVTNKQLKNPKNHIVVEANPELIPILTQHREMNHCSFDIVNKAIGYGSEEMSFYVHERFASSGAHRVTTKKISVPTTTLKEVFTEHAFEYANLICDIEGSEVALVDHELDFLSKHIFQLMVEVHPSIVGEQAVHSLREKLESVGFRKIRTGVDPYGDVLVFENTKYKKTR